MAIEIKLWRTDFTNGKELVLKLYRKEFSNLKVIKIYFFPIFGEYNNNNKFNISGINIIISGIVVDTIFFNENNLFILDEKWFYQAIKKAINTKLLSDIKVKNIISGYLNENNLFLIKKIKLLKKYVDEKLKDSDWSFDEYTYLDKIYFKLLPKDFYQNKEYTLMIHRLIHKTKINTILIKFSKEKNENIKINALEKYTEFINGKYIIHQETKKLIDIIPLYQHSIYIINQKVLKEIIYKILSKCYSHEEKLIKIHEYINYSEPYLNRIQNINNLNVENQKSNNDFLDFIKEPMISKNFDNNQSFIIPIYNKIGRTLYERRDHEVNGHWRTSILGNVHWVNSHKRG